MTSDVKEWDEEATPEVPPPAPGAAAEPTLFFGSVDEFVRERLRYTYTRRVGPQGPNRWSAEWWKSPEAISRLDALNELYRMQGRNEELEKSLLLRQRMIGLGGDEPAGF